MICPYFSIIFLVLISYLLFNRFFFVKQKTAYEIRLSLVGSEMCIRDRPRTSPFQGDGGDSNSPGGTCSLPRLSCGRGGSGSAWAHSSVEEHLPYKQGGGGSSLPALTVPYAGRGCEDRRSAKAHRACVEVVQSLHRGGVVQLVGTPACHAAGRGFESRRSRLVDPQGWLMLLGILLFPGTSPSFRTAGGATR